MSLSFRKSIVVGPMRFNFSKSGMGVSAGFKGFRLGTGPRGNYVSVSALGVSFRQSLGSGTQKSGQGSRSPTGRERAETPLGETCEMREIDSGDVLAMCDSSAADLLAELNGKRKKIRFFPLVLGLGLGGLLVCVSMAPIWLTLTWSFLATAMGFFMRYKDALRKSTVIFYQLSPEAETAYERLHQCFEAICGRAKIWHIPAEGHVTDRKYQAGAGRLVERNRIRPGKNAIETLKTNLDVPVFAVGKQMLALMPDRMLVFDPGGVGAVAYGDLRLEVGETRFIEEETVPRDAEVVGSTWKYVNKKGGPDRRFKDNYEIPIVRYETMHFSSKTGLNERIHLSKPGAGEPLAQCFAALGRMAPHGS